MANTATTAPNKRSEFPALPTTTIPVVSAKTAAGKPPDNAKSDNAPVVLFLLFLVVVVGLVGVWRQRQFGAEYARALWKHWKELLLTGALPAAFGLLLTLTHWQSVVPVWVWFFPAALGVIAAQFLAWRDMREQRNAATCDRDKLQHRYDHPRFSFSPHVTADEIWVDVINLDDPGDYMVKASLSESSVGDSHPEQRTFTVYADPTGGIGEPYPAGLQRLAACLALNEAVRVDVSIVRQKTVPFQGWFWVRCTRLGVIQCRQEGESWPTMDEVDLDELRKLVRTVSDTELVASDSRESQLTQVRALATALRSSRLTGPALTRELDYLNIHDERLADPERFMRDQLADWRYALDRALLESEGSK